RLSRRGSHLFLSVFILKTVDSNVNSRWPRAASFTTSARFRGRRLWIRKLNRPSAKESKSMPEDLPIYSNAMLRTGLQFQDLERFKGRDLAEVWERSD